VQLHATFPLRLAQRIKRSVAVIVQAALATITDTAPSIRRNLRGLFDEDNAAVRSRDESLASLLLPFLHDPQGFRLCGGVGFLLPFREDRLGLIGEAFLIEASAPAKSVVVGVLAIPAREGIISERFSNRPNPPD
jgi:hypothetical protein